VNWKGGQKCYLKVDHLHNELGDERLVALMAFSNLLHYKLCQQILWPMQFLLQLWHIYEILGLNNSTCRCSL
jgi:hypothetical protein